MTRLKTLRVRFALWTAGLLLVMSLLFGLFVYINTAQNLTNVVDSRLSLAAAQIASDVDIEDRERVSMEAFWADEGHLSLREQGFTLQIFDRAGHLFQENGIYTSLPRLPADSPPGTQTGVYASLTDPATDHRLRIYTMPIIEDGRMMGTIQVAQNLEAVQRTLAQLLISLLIGVPLVVLLTGVGGYLLATRALAPIDHLTRTVQRISVEDLSARLDLPPTDDEVGRLATTFDSMLARLDHAFRRERQFTADASHELRTPLAAMQAILSNTLSRRRAPADYEQALVDLKAETQRLRRLVEELLYLARGDVDPTIKFERVNLSLLLADVADSFRPLAEEKGLRLMCHVPDDLILRGDSDHLIRMFANLLSNAIKYTERGQVTVAPGKNGDDFIEIRISDTGPGIAAEHLSHLFDRFYRIDKSRTTSGTGLGLAIALSVAHLHGGTIKVKSQIGEGTVFTVQLAKDLS